MDHSKASLAARHPVHNWEPADQTEREAIALTAEDVGKVALQVDDATFWLVRQVDPSVLWQQIGGGGGGGTPDPHASSHEAGGDDQINVDGLSGELADPQPTTSAQIADATAAGNALLTAANAAAQRTALGLGSAALQPTSAFDAAGDATAAAAAAATALAAHESDSTSIHGIADTSALVTNTRAINTGALLSGGGDLSADRTVKVAFSATDKIAGRASSGAGDGEEIACTAAGRALIDDADAAAQRTTLGLGTAATHPASDFESSGAVTTHDGNAGAHAAGIAGNAATATKLATARTINGVSFDGSANISIPGSGTIADELVLSGILSPTQITADQNDYDPGLSDVSILRISSDNFRMLTGLGGGATGRILRIQNTGNYAIYCDRENGSSSAANRFASGFMIEPGRVVELRYDSSRWRLDLRGSDLDVIEWTEECFSQAKLIPPFEYGGTGDQFEGSANVSTIFNTADHVGLFVFYTDASGKYVFLATIGGGSSKRWQLGRGLLEIEATFGLPNTYEAAAALSDGTDRWEFYGGVFDDPSGPTECAGIYYRDNVNSGKFEAIAVDGGGAATPVDTGITFAVDTVYSMRVVVVSDQKIRVSINNSTPVEIATNITTNKKLYAGITVVRNSGTNGRTLWVDRVKVRKTFAVNRLA